MTSISFSAARERISEHQLETAIVVSFAMAKLLVHLLTNTNYGFQRDAFLYMALSDHLDWGYFSVPPAIAGMAVIIRNTLGDSVFAIRLLPAITGVLSIFLVSGIVKILGGKRWALVIANMAFLLSPAFLRSNTLFQPVTFNQFYWLLSAYLLLRMIHTNNPKYWLHLGILWGWAFMNKYAIVFLVVGLLAGLLMTPERCLFHSRYVLMGMLCGLLIISPNIYWQYAHDWPVINHYLQLQATQFVNVNIPDFLFFQMLMNVHAVPVWLLGLAYLLFFRRVRKFRALGLGFLVVVAILLFMRGKPYYTIGIYSTLFAAGGVAWEKLSMNRWRLLSPVVVVVTILAALPVLPFSLPLLPAEQMVRYGEWSKGWGLGDALRWEDGQLHPLPQDYADMRGWPEMAVIVRNAYLSLDENERRRCVIYTANYGQAGAIRHYGRSAGLPEPVSFNDNYLFWAPLRIDPTVLIYVNDNLGDDIRSFFDDITLAGELNIPYARENGVKVYICRGPRPGFPGYYAENVTRLRAQFE